VIGHMIAFLLTLGLTVPQAVSFQILWSNGRAAEWPCMSEIFMRESSWNPNAIGDYGDSFGLPQRHTPSHGSPDQWPWPVADQVTWAIEYADLRYGGLCEALQFHKEKGYW